MSRARRRYHRTLFLAIAAMGALVWVVVDQFGIKRDELLNLILGAVLIVLAIIVAAACVMLVWVTLRKLFGKSDD